MRKENYSKTNVINLLRDMQGKEVKMKVNLGRKKVVFLDGVVKDIYPAVFTVALKGEEKIVTYSYSSVLCGDVKFKRA